MNVPLATSIGPIDYAEHGPRSGPAIIFLHHGFGTRHSLADLAKRLMPSLAEFRCILYSRPGSGASPPLSPPRPPGYLTREADLVLPAVMDALGIARADLVGHSDGGSIALIAGARHPSRVRSLCAIAPHVILEERTLQGIRSLPDLERAPGFRQRLSQKHRDVSVAYESWRRLWLSPSMAGWDITPNLAGIRCPVGLLQGAKDQYGTFRQLDLIETAIPNELAVSLRLSEAGHEPHKSHPDAVTEFCLDTIRSAMVSQASTDAF